MSTESYAVQYARTVLEQAGYEVSKKPEPPSWPYVMTEAELFEQSKVWIDKHGNQWEISDMTLEYVANVLRFLRMHWNTVPEQTTLGRALMARLINAAYNWDRDDLRRPTTAKHYPPSYSKLVHKTAHGMTYFGRPDQGY